MLGRGPYFYLGLVVAAAIALYHFRLIRGRDRDRCFRAFLHNAWFGGVIFVGLALDYRLYNTIPLTAPLQGF